MVKHESAVLVRIGAVVVFAWLAAAGAVRLGHGLRALDPPAGVEDGEVADPEQPAGITPARGSGAMRPAVVFSVSPSTLSAGRISTFRITGSRLDGAFVTGSPGMVVMLVQIEADTLILEVFVDAAATPGMAALTLVTASGAISVPIIIAAGGDAAIMARDAATDERSRRPVAPERSAR
jgi:Quinohemoprotein amine dehydrogenase, alpha subunit domain III